MARPIIHNEFLLRSHLVRFDILAHRSLTDPEKWAVVDRYRRTEAWRRDCRDHRERCALGRWIDIVLQSPVGVETRWGTTVRLRPVEPAADHRIRRRHSADVRRTQRSTTTQRHRPRQRSTTDRY